MKHKYEGFTLIEILVVVGLIAILAAVTIIAINPAKNFADTRNAQRSADVTAILNAVTQYTSEEGQSVDDLNIWECGSADANAVFDAGTDEIDLDNDLVDEYIVAIPEDPEDGSGDGTVSGYTVCKTAGGRIQVDAPSAENSATISVKR